MWFCLHLCPNRHNRNLVTVNLNSLRLRRLWPPQEARQLSEPLQQECDLRLDVVVEEAVQDGVGAGRGDAHQVTDQVGEQHRGCHTHIYSLLSTCLQVTSDQGTDFYVLCFNATWLASVKGDKIFTRFLMEIHYKLIENPQNAEWKPTGRSDVYIGKFWGGPITWDRIPAIWAAESRWFFSVSSSALCWATGGPSTEKYRVQTEQR